MRHGQLFFETYVPPRAELTIVEIGAQNVDGSLRDVAPKTARYIGVDFVSGRGVDVVLTDPYELPLDDALADIVVSSSCFEHSEFFWLSFLEMVRITKPTGLIYLNAPANGPFHRFPVDCWRFYPDSGVALQNWARRNGTDVLMLESFTGGQHSGVWNDFVAVFLKDQRFAHAHKKRIQDTYKDYSNGRLAQTEDISNFAEFPQDQQARDVPRRLKIAVRKRLGHQPT
jgi:SAM-dependent methyltransferase